MVFYLGGNFNFMMSYIFFVEDIVEIVFFFLFVIEIFVVGCEIFDGELFNMGMNMM